MQHNSSNVIASPLRPIRTLFLIDHLGIGGVQEFILNYAERARGEEITVASLFSNDVYSDRLRAAGAEVIQVGSASYSYASILNPKNFRAFRDFIQRNLDRFDSVHIRLFASFMYGSLSGLFRDPRVSAGIDATRHQLPPQINAMYWLFARRYQRFYLHPMYAEDFAFLRLSPGALREQHYFVTDRSGGNPFPFPARYNLLSIGRCIRQKGHHDAIAFFERLRPRLPAPCDLYVIGDGPFLPELRSSLPSSLREAVHFTGSVANLSDFMTGCSAILKMSMGEGQNSVLREAALLGRPVLSTLETPDCQNLAHEGLIVPIDREASPAALARAEATLTSFTINDAVSVRERAMACWGDEAVGAKIRASFS